jgi:glycosyltransferase involved in cell wall biosynthesis
MLNSNYLEAGIDHFKVAVFHDNFAQNGGAERVAEALYRTLRSAFPDTELLSTLSATERLSPYLRGVRIKNTWMQRLPARAKLFRAYFMLYPIAVDRVDLSEYDLVVTSCFGYAKGVHRRPGALHVCYSHTPMRWVWRTKDYLAREEGGRLKGALLAMPLRLLKEWELRAARRPDLYIANSSVVAERLYHAFGVDAAVIPPPVDTTRFGPDPGAPIAAPEDFYLVLSRLVPYKRFDLAVEACTRSGRRLVVIGDGPDRPRLQAMAGPTVSFLGRASDEVVIDHARRCRALIFPGEEDFGIAALEINAAGRPIAAYSGGGATETVIEGLNGTFFDDPTPEALVEALDRLESVKWDPEAIRRHALGYDVTVFQSRITDFIRQALLRRASSETRSAELVNA